MAQRFHIKTLLVNAKTRRAFQRDLAAWYAASQRPLPWRGISDPYRTWISEIMLQQTRVEVVIDYYQRWLQAFPNLETLARAPMGRVLKLWEGLGYYSRARNLHRAAKLMRGHAFPATVAELCELPGIGRYTAGAIASIAFDQRAPIVDGNVARVLARVFGLTGDVTKPNSQKTLWALAESLLPDKNCGDFNQSLMELGALVCTPQNPQCSPCPMRRVCVAKARGWQNRLPNRGARRLTRRVIHDVTLIQHEDKILLRRRPAKGLLAGLWELPAGRSHRPLLTVRHTITDQRITLRVFTGEVPADPGEARWISRRQLARLTMPAAHRRALEQILSAQQ